MAKNSPKAGKKASSPRVPPKATAKASSKASHKRKKKTTPSTNNISIYHDTPIYDMLHEFEKAPHQWAARYILVLTAIILRAAIGLGSFLGQGQGPINGDFEAQRHWMELTIHLPMSKWYFYDLEYWGLDYPPLTAFHLYIFGKLGSFIDPQWFALDSSRGIEDRGIKTFMRISSLLSELVVYIPALFGVISLIGKQLRVSRMDQIVITCIILCQPSLVLIDHGHFQYNSVMLGSFLFSILDLLKENYILSAVWFVICIFFKQMGLYYAPFIFAFMLASGFTNYYDIPNPLIWKVARSFNLKQILSIGLAVAWTMLVILLPFIFGPEKDHWPVIQQIFIRIFPFQRGLFEDKVANFWCVTNLLVKYKSIFSVQELTRLSLATTLLSLLPPCAIIFFKRIFKESYSKKVSPRPQAVPVLLGFAATAWSFYLFSFQVHEKTVLVPLLPTTLLYLVNDLDWFAIVSWVNNAALFSMWPLLKKDNLVLQYTVHALLSNWLLGGFTFDIRKNLLIPKRNKLWQVVIGLSYASMAAFHVIDYLVIPPEKYPDLWVILNSTIAFGIFSITWIWLLYNLYIH